MVETNEDLHSSFQNVQIQPHLFESQISGNVYKSTFRVNPTRRLNKMAVMIPYDIKNEEIGQVDCMVSVINTVTTAVKSMAFFCASMQLLIRQ